MPDDTIRGFAMSIVAFSQQPLFPIGSVVATPASLKAMAHIGIQPLSLLHRHVCGDWGDIDPEDRQTNIAALAHGSRLMSSYKLPAGPEAHAGEAITVWLITEADRSVTTFLLPSEY